MLYYAITLIVLITLPITTYHLRREERKPGTTYLYTAFFALYQWLFCAFFEAMNISQQAKVTLSMIQYIGYSTYPVLILLFALSYSGICENNPLKDSRLKLLFIPSIFITLAAFTNPFHHLVWTGFSPGMGVTMIYHHGPLFWIFTLVFFLEVLATVSTFFLTAILDKDRRKEAQTLMWILSLPWWAGILYVTEWSPFPGYDITSLFAGVSATIISLLLVTKQISFKIPRVIREKLPDDDTHWIVTDRNGEIRYAHSDIDLTPDQWRESVLHEGAKIAIIPIDLYGKMLTLHLKEPLEESDFPPEQGKLIQELEKLFSHEQLYTNQALDLETLAMRLKTNRSYLSQAVNRQYEMSLPNLINRYRVEHYIEETRRSAELYSIEERAKMAGFSCKSTFYRVFRKSHGMSPKEWHDQYQNENA